MNPEFVYTNLILGIKSLNKSLPLLKLYVDHILASTIARSAKRSKPYVWSYTQSMTVVYSKMIFVCWKSTK